MPQKWVGHLKSHKSLLFKCTFVKKLDVLFKKWPYIGKLQRENSIYFFVSDLKMVKMKKRILWIGIISFWLFFVLEIATDIWFGAKFPGYNWKTQSLSYLGQSGSPMENQAFIWGVVFTILIFAFAFSFYQLNRSNRWAKVATARDNFMLSFKGVWQRIYLYDYYLMLLVVSRQMAQKIRLL